MKNTNIHPFATWADAFRACRASRKPMIVKVPITTEDAELARIYCSGRCKHIAYSTIETQTQTPKQQ